MAYYRRSRDNLRANLHTNAIETYFACDRHEIVVANGCLSESLLLGPMVMQDLSENQRDAVYEIFRSDTQSAALNGPPARPCLKVGEVRRTLKKIGRKQLELV